MKKETCASCRFAPDGKCHRFPRNGNSFTSDYPVVFQDDWCGEYQPRDIEPQIPQEVAEPTEPQEQPKEAATNGKAKRNKKG